MIDDVVRPHVPRYAGPLLALYARLRVTPDQVTIAGLLLAILAAVAVAREQGWVALALWWVSRAVDGTDGVYARHSGQATSFGAYLDILADMTAYGAMVLGFAIARPEHQPAWLLMLFLYILCITSALALGAGEERLAHAPRDERGLRLGAGLAEGGETGIAYSIFLLFPQQLALSTKLWIAVLALTVVLRTILARRLLREPAAGAAAAPSRVSRSTSM